MRLSRREWLIGVSAVALTGPAVAQSGIADKQRVRPVPLGSVRLKPSIFADAQRANRAYLASLEPVRLLHNFYLSAGLEAPKPIYGGWEARGIAGHSLGHWLSGVSLIIANTGDAELSQALDHCLTEIARIQAAHGDGYCGGTTVERDGKIVDGKVVFEEVRRGEISSHGFDLNGGWVPLYTWHKVHAGLIDAIRLAGNPRAMPIMLGLAGYLADVLEPLTDLQIQQVLAAEHGGLNETYADTYALTGDERWLRIARRIYHNAVLDPLAAGEDHLDGLHANTQIPKVIGLARLHELTGDADMARAARFFHRTVVDHHSYVIGGNSEREHFGPPDHRAHRISEATCEACNSYNMLKLTRHLYSWAPDARQFDFYERVQLNHIMAHQRPDTGQFVYFMPLAAGARRIYSDPEDSFWCCVGSGMESHAKHADSIFWADRSTLYVNLYIPSELDWAEGGLALTLDTGMPREGNASLKVARAPRRKYSIAMRLPGWAASPRLVLNGRLVELRMRDGYAVIERRWQQGDTLELTLPMRLAVEHTPDDPSIVAFTHGPLVLAADLGAADEQFAGPGPALVGDAGVDISLFARSVEEATYSVQGALGERLTLRPFFDQYDRRAAVYFPSFSSADWASRRTDYLRAQQESQELARRTVDTFYLGEMQPERDHEFVPGNSEAVNWNGRSARRLSPGDSMSMVLARPEGASVLRVLVWHADSERRFAIAYDGARIDQNWPSATSDGGFVALDFPLPVPSAGANEGAEVAITALDDQALVYEMRTLTSE